MKKQLHHLSITIGFLFSIIVGVRSENPFIDNPPDYLPLELVGQLDYNTGHDDIEAYVDGNNVYVYFHRDFGYVSISLYNETGLMVYSNVVNTSVQQTVIIPISGTSDGTYTLMLENAFGILEGDFNKGS